MTETYKFKKGDRVRYTAHASPVRYGSVGTVLQDCGFPFVAWDAFTGGHDYSTNDGSVNQWAVSGDNMELIEASAASFKIGQRVRVVNACHRAKYHDCEGVVVEGNYPPYIAVMLDGTDHRSYWAPEDLESVEPAKPEVYVTAWDCDDGLSLTHDTPFETKEAADAHAKHLLRDGDRLPVAVLKMVSKHSSAVTVTSEDV